MNRNIIYVVAGSLRRIVSRVIGNTDNSLRSQLPALYKGIMMDNICKHCDAIIHKVTISASIWHDNNLVFPQYCNTDKGGKLHEPRYPEYTEELRSLKWQE